MVITLSLNIFQPGSVNNVEKESSAGKSQKRYADFSTVNKNLSEELKSMYLI
jgi:hypothetical protein